ncbi:hypothetical protein RG47T_4288 [Mucilaginibacter polytrichastri]|uniref:Uncharacterized protein n=1 Tax=Mucilaginibacter polytrichastri TaxID=1302689 RepID=A0A1Q6A483_9SPHI|nr:hypothetical protein RG47T_4288 [Mucilaginibacter polytrichastri]
MHKAEQTVVTNFYAFKLPERTAVHFFENYAFIDNQHIMGKEVLNGGQLEQSK